MEHKKLQELVNKVFTDAFVHTPLTKRLEDIEGECRELVKFTDLSNLKEEAGDLLASLIQLCNESGWDISDLLKENEAKINRRMLQYKGMGRKANIAILGGAFNPVTTGHINVAQLVLNASRWADEVWLMPCYQHMDGKNMTSPEQRMDMLNEAVKVDGRIKVSDYEVKHQLHGETYHMLNKLIHDKEYEHCRFGFIIGQDRADTIDNWYNSNELLKMDVSFIVVPRVGFDRDPKVNWYLQHPNIYIADEGDVPYEISSSIVRDLIKTDNVNGISKYINNNVYEYINKNNLYLK